MIFVVIRKHFIYLILLSFLLLNSACQLRDPSKTHGINYLENREKQLVLNQTNKNDVVKILGRPHVTSLNNENNWVYIERVMSKGALYKLGKNELLQNNILELNFDKYGVLVRKKIYSKEDMNKIKYSENETENNVSQESFVSGILQSLREKIYNENKF